MTALGKVRKVAYKHKWTRCYFHLADDGGRSTTFPKTSIARSTPYPAITAAFANWQHGDPTEEERAALDEASRRALSGTG